MNKGSECLNVMLAFGDGNKRGQHVRKCLVVSRQKFCPHAAANKVAVSLKETAVPSLETDYSAPCHSFTLQRLRNYGHREQHFITVQVEAETPPGQRATAASDKNGIITYCALRFAREMCFIYVRQPFK